MKIGVLTGAHIPSLYAHSISVMKMAQGFFDLGHESVVVTADCLPDRLAQRRFTDLSVHYGVSDKLQLHRLIPSWRAFVTGSVSADRTFCKRAAKHAKLGAYDLVYCRNFLIPVETARLGIPTVVETHTTQFCQADLQRIYEVARLPAFRALITIHERIKAAHVARGVPEEKVLVLEDGVDISRFDISDDRYAWRKRLALNPELRWIVYSGHLYPDKGIDVLLNLAEQLRNLPDIRLLLVGGFPRHRRRWSRECRRRRLTNVAFTGFVPNAAVPGYLKAADCLLLPYDPTRMHKVMDLNTTSPLKLFEYMAAGRPIIAADVPIVTKVLRHEHSAWLYDPANIDTFLERVLHALELPNEAASISRQAAADAHFYSWRARCEAVLARANLSASLIT